MFCILKNNLELSWKLHCSAINLFPGYFLSAIQFSQGVTIQLQWELKFPTLSTTLTLVDNSLFTCPQRRTLFYFPHIRASEGICRWSKSSAFGGERGHHLARWQRNRVPIQETQVQPWRRKWQPPPAFLPGKSRGQRSPVGYGPWGRKKAWLSD